MGKMKKLLALLLALVMVLALAACGTAGDTGDDTAEPTAKPADDAGDDAADDAADDAGDDAAAESWYGIAPYEGETPTLKWYCVNTGSDVSDQATVMEALNALLLERYNIQIDWTVWGHGEYDDKMNLVINSNEDYDLCYCSEGWVCKYNAQCEKGAFLALDDLIDQYEPDLWNVLPEGKWDAARYADGLVHCVPNTQKCFSGSAICIQKPYADEYGLDIEALQGLDENGMRELFPFFQWCLENYPDMYVSDAGGFSGFGYYNWVNRDRQFEVLQGCFLDITTNTVVDGWETSVELATVYHDMYKAGYIRDDIASVTDNTSELKADRYICRGSVFKPGQEAEYKNSGNGADWYMIRIGDPIVTKEAVRSTMTAISQNCKNVPAALKFIHILYKDPEVLNMLNYGVEGTHYEVTEDGLVQNLNNGYFYNQGWATGLQFLLTPTVGNSPTLWEETQEIETNARTESIMSFTPDYESLTTELSQLSSVWEEHEFDYTMDDAAFEASLDALHDALYAAGMQTVLDELQTQIDAWVK